MHPTYAARRRDAQQCSIGSSSAATLHARLVEATIAGSHTAMRRDFLKMSCPWLKLHIAAAAGLVDVSSFLGVDISAAREEPGCARQPRVRIGQIGVWWATDSRLEYGNYAAPWNLIVTFGGPYSWSTIRLQMVLALCAHLGELRGGTYLGLYDTGSVAFHLEEGALRFPDLDREYLSRFPIPFKEFSFAPLPPV